MPLQSSGPISLANIQTEFGGTNPINISEYYRNGGLVPSSATSVPTSGAIGLSNFYGASALTGTILISNVTIANAVPASQFTSYSGIALGASGKLLAFANQYAPDWFEIAPINEWLDPESLAFADGFECRGSGESGNGGIGSEMGGVGYATTAWTRLGSGGGTRYWYIANGNPGSTTSSTFTIEIRNRNTLQIMDTAVITLNAQLGPSGGGGGFEP